MKKAGGIIAIIAGVFGVLAAGFTLTVGGIASAFEADRAQTVVNLGWGGVLFSFLTIIFGAISIGAKSKTPGILLAVSGALGIILGGGLVAIFMFLAFVGGILAFMGAKNEVPEVTEEVS